MKCKVRGGIKIIPIRYNRHRVICSNLLSELRFCQGPCPTMWEQSRLSIWQTSAKLLDAGAGARTGRTVLTELSPNQIKCIYIALCTSADISKCCTDTQPKIPNSKHCRCRSTVARKNSLDRPKPRKKPREEPGYEGWRLICLRELVAGLLLLWGEVDRPLIATSFNILVKVGKVSLYSCTMHCRPVFLMCVTLGKKSAF
jgi:hypothetical protein